MVDFFEERRPHDGLTYSEYRADWQEQKARRDDDADPDERRMHHYLNYNWERQARVHDQFSPSEALEAALASVSAPQLWMVLTEPWCGDSAYLLPVIAEAAARSEQITLRILLRDDNLDIMDQYLTDGGRSIPKLVAFSEEGDERFVWGPRPEGASERFQTLRAEYGDKKKVIAELLEYYEEGGWREAETELTQAIRSSTPAQSSASS